MIVFKGPIEHYADRFVDAETSPLVLSSAVGPLAIGGAMQSAAESDMVNRCGKPLLIDAIKIQCGLMDGAGGQVRTDLVAPAGQLPADTFLLSEAPLRQLQARFTLGGIQLTRDWIQVWGLSGEGDMRSNSQVMVFRPRVPIYVEHGELLKVDIRYPSYSAPAIKSTAGTSTASTTVTPQVTFACRVLENAVDWLREGEARVLPYLTSYLPAPFAMFAVTNQQSSDSDLMNAADADLYVHALVGRCLTQIFDTSLGALDTTMQARAGASPGPLANISELGLVVRMESSQGNAMIAAAIPFGHAFSVVDATWWMNAKLRPGGFFRAYLDADFTPATLFMDDSTTVSPSITLHGSFFSKGFGASTRWSQGSRDAELAEVRQQIGNDSLR
jgi:hypothetical protein